MVKRTYEEIIKNFPNLMKDINLNTDEVNTSKKNTSFRSVPRYKVSISKDKEIFTSGNSFKVERKIQIHHTQGSLNTTTG